MDRRSFLKVYAASVATMGVEGAVFTALAARIAGIDAELPRPLKVAYDGLEVIFK